MNYKMGYVIDSTGRLLHEGDLVDVGGKIGAYVSFEEDYSSLMSQGVLSGQLVVEVEEQEERLPTFSTEAGNVCYDVRALLAGGISSD